MRSIIRSVTHGLRIFIASVGVLAIASGAAGGFDGVLAIAAVLGLAALAVPVVYPEGA